MNIHEINISGFIGEIHYLPFVRKLFRKTVNGHTFRYLLEYYQTLFKCQIWLTSLLFTDDSVDFAHFLDCCPFHTLQIMRLMSSLSSTLMFSYFSDKCHASVKIFYSMIVYKLLNETFCSVSVRLECAVRCNHLTSLKYFLCGDIFHISRKDSWMGGVRTFLGLGWCIEY